MNKIELISAIVVELERVYEIALSATQAAINDATDEETVPEHKYDTLALEASYLAHGQAVRVQECEKDILTYKTLIEREVANGSAVSGNVRLGSFVILIDEDDKSSYFFMGPCAGGVSVEYQAMKVAIVTENAPLGRAMMGKAIGDEVELRLGAKTVFYDVETVI